MPSELTFDEERHQYELDGVKLPSVTQILSPFFHLLTPEFVWILPRSPGSKPVLIDRKVWDRAGEFGQAVHLATSLYDDGKLDEDDLDPDLKGCLNAWKRFKEDCQVEIIYNEKRLASKESGYAGTLDRFVWMYRAPVKKRRRKVLLDIKSGVFINFSFVGMQTAAYKELVVQLIECRCSVQLNSDGTYKIDWLDDQSDWPDFLSCLRIYRRKERYE